MDRKINKKHILAGLNWLKLAQDKTTDGGVSAWFSLVGGWQASYIETTGYIINTFLDCSEFFDRKDLEKRAIKMADFLVKMQLKSGGFRTSTPNIKKKSPPTVFNTGQDLLGLTAIYKLTKQKKYLNSCLKAANFLCKIQETNGAWIQNTYGNTKHTYHTRVAWGLLKVYQIAQKSFPDQAQKYKLAAIKNLNWAAKQQFKNGWFEKNELPPPNIDLPYTHTISYAIEGFWWSGLILKENKYLKIALRGAKPLLDYYLKHDFLPGSFDKNWQSNDKYSCLTGNAQIALMWWEMYKKTKNRKFLQGAKKMNHYLKSRQVLSLPFINLSGALAGSEPLWGDLLKNKGYCRLAYPNWAVKFYIDTLLAEIKITNVQ